MSANDDPEMPPEGSKAHRVFLLMRDEIARGDYETGRPLPGEHKLAEARGVSRVTIRKALDALAAHGLVTRRPGRGAVVRARPGDGIAIKGDLATLMPQLLEMGEATTARLLEFSYGTPPPAVAAALDIDGTAQVQRAVRVRMVDGRVFSHLTTHVPAAIALNYS